MGQVGTDLRKDAARRTYIGNQAALAQKLENERGKSIGNFTNVLAQAAGEWTSPIRPGGEKHGEFMDSLEAAGLKMEEQRAGQQANMQKAAEQRQQWIRHIRSKYGRDPDPWDWDMFRSIQENRG